VEHGETRAARLFANKGGRGRAVLATLLRSAALARAICLAGAWTRKGRRRRGCTGRRRSTEQGHVLAQCNLADCYSMGEGVEADQARAARPFGKAVERGDAVARLHLSWCYCTSSVSEYEHGQRVGQDASAAMEQYRPAAERGCAVPVLTLACALRRAGACRAATPSRLHGCTRWQLRAAPQPRRPSAGS
jgi:TPR repeat protein